jgi:hypothetical protein
VFVSRARRGGCKWGGGWAGDMGVCRIVEVGHGLEEHVAVEEVDKIARWAIGLGVGWMDEVAGLK